MYLVYSAKQELHQLIGKLVDDGETDFDCIEAQTARTLLSLWAHACPIDFRLYYHAAATDREADVFAESILVSDEAWRRLIMHTHSLRMGSVLDSAHDELQRLIDDEVAHRETRFEPGG